jgi:hypothetical protein
MYRERMKALRMKALIVPAKGEPRVVEDCAGTATWLLEGVMYTLDEDGSRDSGMPVYREASWAPAPWLKPKGIDSPIAMHAMLEAQRAEIAAIVKRIQGTAPLMPDAAYEGIRGIEAWLPPPAPPSVRKPALPHAEQKTARPGVTYHVWGRPGVAALIVASDGKSGRMLSVPESAWIKLCAGTEAPSGEVALTDDDLETLLCDCWALTWRLQPSTSFSEVAEVYHELKEMLFRSDPDVIAHVRKQMEVDNIIGDIQIEPRMSLGLDKAWQRTFAGHQPEHAWMVRAAHRASEILRLRQEATEKGSVER